MTNHLPCLREREALAVERDLLAGIIVDNCLCKWQSEVTRRLMAGAIERDIARYQALTKQIDARGEVVMGPGDWRRATVQTRLEGISDGVR